MCENSCELFHERICIFSNKLQFILPLLLILFLLTEAVANQGALFLWGFMRGAHWDTVAPSRNTPGGGKSWGHDKISLRTCTKIPFLSENKTLFRFHAVLSLRVGGSWRRTCNGVRTRGVKSVGRGQEHFILYRTVGKTNNCAVLIKPGNGFL